MKGKEYKMNILNTIRIKKVEFDCELNQWAFLISFFKGDKLFVINFLCFFLIFHYDKKI